MKKLQSLQLQKFPLLNHLSITHKSARYGEFITPKLVNCTVDAFKNCKISNIKPLNIKENDTLSPPRLEQACETIDEIFEFDPNQLQNIFNKFLVNVDVNQDLLDCSNLIRKSIQQVKIFSHRLDELFLLTTTQSNTMDLLSNKQISMKQIYIEQK
ncbi:Hypothetical_protein [Hexamita inflata]|uniref:Hypothetical_protein n=1 Tax=Hexamita inflata TaxID=28002 RepID=A0AA86RMN7_9EUKA|nr:Hypothetical protein HINF_LOCUS62332 [Hexamita inflata]